MRATVRALTCFAVGIACALGGGHPVDAAETTVRIAVLVPPEDPASLLGREVAYGVALAVDESEDVRKAGGKRPAVEIVPLTAGDGAGATSAIEAAAKGKCAGVVALVTPATAEEVEAAARKAKLPVIVLGACSPRRTIDAADVVFRAEPEAGDTALAIVEALHLRSAKSSLGLPSKTTHAWLVADDAPWSRAVAAAVHADDVGGIVVPGDAFVAAGGSVGAADVAKARSAGCDRVVVAGGPATLRAVLTALDGAGWEVPVLASEAALDATALPGAPAKHRSAAFVVARPLGADERRLDGLAKRRAPPSGADTPVTPAAAKAFAAAASIVEAATTPSKRGIAGALRDVPVTLGTLGVPAYDPAGSMERWSRPVWAADKEGRLAPVRPTFLPDAALGPLLGGRPTSRLRAAADHVAVRIGFGGTEVGIPRTIDEDLATLGLRGDDAAKEAYGLVLDEIVARTAGKLSRIYQRSYDGSARPAFSWRIAFVGAGADTAGASHAWDAVIAGDGPDGLHGGQAFPAQKRCQALSTYLLRNSAVLRRARLEPPLAASDVPALRGEYAWNDSAEGNQRADRLRALLDGVASAFAMKLAKEVGHLAGLGVDHSGDPRSVMVAKGGEGTPDEAAYFPPAHAKVLEKTLGRVAGILAGR